ncbi:MAG: hypothetical protein II192_00525, partial [Clostridia bacterium]|nr:hypothetical protein [Clostridia bacterium]
MTGRSLLYVFSRRKLPVYLALLLAFSFIIGKLFYMQVMQYDYYQEKVIDQVTVESTEKAARGNIYGANMEVLATNITAWRVFISPRDIKKAESKTSVSRVFARFRGEMTVSETEGALDQSEVISRGLADILDVDYETIKKKTEKKNRLDETIKAQVDEKTKNRVLEFVEQNGLTNQVHVQALSVRYYPHGSVAGAVLGFTGTDGNGLYGLEYSYDSELTGTPGRYITARDGYGNDMPYDYETYFEAESGLSVVTTIDPVIQKSLERQLELTFAYSAPNARAAGVVMNVKTITKSDVSRGVGRTIPSRTVKPEDELPDPVEDDDTLDINAETGEVEDNDTVTLPSDEKTAEDIENERLKRVKDTEEDFQIVLSKMIGGEILDFDINDEAANEAIVTAGHKVSKRHIAKIVELHGKVFFK